MKPILRGSRAYVFGGTYSDKVRGDPVQHQHKVNIIFKVSALIL